VRADPVSIGAARKALAEETRHPLLFRRRNAPRAPPLGVVGVIGPWNFPILTTRRRGSPLLAGNAVVLKPSEARRSRLSGSRSSGARRQSRGRLPCRHRRGAAGAALVEQVDGVMFTGSVATGRKVASRAGERLIPCVTELGGKSPFVVLASANLERAAEAAAWSASSTAGRPASGRSGSTSWNRCRPVRGAPRRAGPGLRQGPGSADRRRARPRRRDLPASARDPRAPARRRALERGAPRLGGSGGETSGYFFEPTLLLGATQEMAVMREETFGPLVASCGEGRRRGLRLANDTHLGLNATVFGARARRWRSRGGSSRGRSSRTTSS